MPRIKTNDTPPFISFKYVKEKCSGIESYLDIKECRDDPDIISGWSKGTLITVVDPIKRHKRTDLPLEYEARFIESADSKDELLLPSKKMQLRPGKRAVKVNNHKYSDDSSSEEEVDEDGSYHPPSGEGEEEEEEDEDVIQSSQVPGPSYAHKEARKQTLKRKREIGAVINSQIEQQDAATLMRYFEEKEKSKPDAEHFLSGLSDRPEIEIADLAFQRKINDEKDQKILKLEKENKALTLKLQRKECADDRLSNLEGSMKNIERFLFVLCQNGQIMPAKSEEPATLKYSGKGLSDLALDTCSVDDHVPAKSNEPSKPNYTGNVLSNLTLDTCSVEDDVPGAENDDSNCTYFPEAHESETERFEPSETSTQKFKSTREVTEASKTLVVLPTPTARLETPRVENHTSPTHDEQVEGRDSRPSTSKAGASKQKKPKTPKHERDGVPTWDESACAGKGANRNGGYFLNDDIYNLEMISKIRSCFGSNTLNFTNHAAGLVRLCDTFPVYVNLDHLQKARVACKEDPRALSKLLLPLVFKANLIKYCSVSGKKGTYKSGYITTDGISHPYAPLHKNGIDAILSYSTSINKGELKSEADKKKTKEELAHESSIKNILNKECQRVYRGRLPEN